MADEDNLTFTGSHMEFPRNPSLLPWSRDWGEITHEHIEYIGNKCKNDLKGFAYIRKYLYKCLIYSTYVTCRCANV